jgi:molybdenum cofactor cytidylyltransferase
LALSSTPKLFYVIIEIDAKRVNYISFFQVGEKMKITVSVLAAGESSRFKGEKLLHVYREKTITEHVLDKINKLNDNDSFSFQRVVITKPALLNFYQQKLLNNWSVINNESYKEGMSTSLKLAVLEAVHNKADFLLLFLADMPMIKQITIYRVIEKALESPEKIIRPYFNNQPGFPVALPKALFEELTLLAGDVGAKPVIEKHKEHLIKLECNDSGSIFDIDEDIWSMKEK